MKLFKKLLFKILPIHSYLRILQISFYFLYDLNLLRKKEEFKYHYMIRNLIAPDYTVVDIGANLGYFSKNFARLASKGKVISIEPVPLFFQALQKLMKKFPNAELHNIALGTENGSITMVLPESDGMIRTGLPHIAKSEKEKAEHKTQEVKIIKGSELLGLLDKIDYIKCDIEGYELIVFTEIKSLLEKHQPYVQIEIASENITAMSSLFEEMGYTLFGIQNFRFKQIEAKENQGDFFFVPKNKLQSFTEKFTRVS